MTKRRYKSTEPRAPRIPALPHALTDPVYALKNEAGEVVPLSLYFEEALGELRRAAADQRMAMQLYSRKGVLLAVARPVT